ncbi:MAG: glycosyltransferase family 4 protein [FCB group bacterium]|nr:glycosyltransferase family 4 protein [FCB group bacterium]
MKVALCCELLDGPRSGLRIALDNFLNGIIKENKQQFFNLIHHLPFEDNDYSEFSDYVIARSKVRFSHLFWSQFKVPHRIKKLGFDILHWPYQLMPPVYTKIPQVISVWDFAPLHYHEPGWDLFNTFVKYRLILCRALPNASHIIAHSQAIADEIMESLNIPAKKISVIYPCLSDAFEDEIEQPIMINTEGYILYVGSDTPRKNLNLLLKAYSLVLKKGVVNQLALRVNCVTMTKEQLKKKAESIGIPHNKLMFIDGTNVGGLKEIYKKAAIFTFPSLYEGFGLPLIEAMSFGLPVVALNRSAMTEVVGKAGILVDDASPKSFAQGILEALDICKRGKEDFGLMAKAKAAQYKWSKTVSETLLVYEKVIGRT